MRKVQQQYEYRLLDGETRRHDCAAVGHSHGPNRRPARLWSRLRGFLATTLDDRPKAFLAGMGLTTVLQSSTATGLMVTGFAAGGLIGLVPALAVMLGAN